MISGAIFPVYSNGDATMSLNWDLSRIPNYEQVCWYTNDEGQKCLRQVTERLIWVTLDVGMGEFITDEDFKEFWLRLRIVAGLFETSAASVTVNDLKVHRGLRTNMSKEPRTKWLKRMLKAAEYEHRNILQERDA